MTPYTTDAALALAGATLIPLAAAQGAFFAYAGETIPTGTTRIIQVTFVDDAPAPDYESDGESTRLQVNTVAPALHDAVRLGGAVRAALEAVGFTRRGGRYLPKPPGDLLNGYAADYAR